MTSKISTDFKDSPEFSGIQMLRHSLSAITLDTGRFVAATSSNCKDNDACKLTSSFSRTRHTPFTSNVHKHFKMIQIFASWSGQFQGVEANAIECFVVKQHASICTLGTLPVGAHCRFLGRRPLPVLGSAPTAFRIKTHTFRSPSHCILRKLVGRQNCVLPKHGRYQLTDVPPQPNSPNCQCNLTTGFGNN